MRKHFKLVGILCVLALCFATLPSLDSAVQAASARPQTSTTGLVESTNPIASQIGMDVLNNGGNAMDAAAAVGFALAVVHPAAGNIGGGGFAVIHTAKGENITLDFREKAPEKASRNMYLDKNGDVVKDSSITGYLAAGVPGTVKGMSALLERFGTKPLAELMKPSIKLAEEGFVISPRQAETMLASADRFRKFASSRQYFLKPDGASYQAGDRFIQKDLGKTLRLIARQGPDAFYKGKIADLIAADMAANGGIVTKKDLADYQVAWRAPVTGTYRGYEIISMAPPSSGGTHLIEILNVMEGYDMKAMGFGSSQAVHVMAEAMRRAYADRAEYMGDPAFVNMPLQGLLSKEYAAHIRSQIKPDRATPSSQVGPGNPAAYESNNTTHYSIVDKFGNAVSVTYTINGSYGSAAAVKGAGFLLNNEMDDFSIKPGVPNLYGLVGGEANAVAPGKIPLSSMTPTIVLKDGKLFMVVGSPGGARIITTVLQVISNVIDYGMNIREAIDAPRIHMQWLPDEIRIEKYGLAPDVIEKLKTMGYTVVVKAPMGDVNAIMIDPATGEMSGGGDPRTEF